MEFEYQDKAYTFPVMLRDITLGQRVGYYNTYGKELDQRAEEITKMEDGFEKGVLESIWHGDMATASLSWYTGIPLEEVRGKISLSSIMAIYNTDMQLLMEQEAALELQQRYQWNDMTWMISTPELLPDNEMTLDEFITGKEITRQLHAAGQGKWEALPYLCAIYLRPEGEPFDERNLLPDSDRMKLMDTLPLDIALAVAFFLSSTLSIYLSTLASSSPAKERESILPVTSTDGAG